MVEIETADGRTVQLFGGFEDPLDEDDEELEVARLRCASSGSSLQDLRDMVYPAADGSPRIVRLVVGGRQVFALGLVEHLGISFERDRRLSVVFSIRIKKLEGNPA